MHLYTYDLKQYIQVLISFILWKLKTILKEYYLEENLKSSCFPVSNLNIKYIRKYK